jgi:hypothetical protein
MGEKGRVSDSEADLGQFYHFMADPIKKLHKIDGLSRMRSTATCKTARSRRRARENKKQLVRIML